MYFLFTCYLLLQKPNLILNVDGFIGVAFVDLLNNCGCFTRFVCSYYSVLWIINSNYAFTLSANYRPCCHYIWSKKWADKWQLNFIDDAHSTTSLHLIFKVNYQMASKKAVDCFNIQGEKSTILMVNLKAHNLPILVSKTNFRNFCIVEID